MLKISRFLFQSICGALFFTRFARTFSLASAAVGLRVSPLSSNGSFFSTSPSCMEKDEKMFSPRQHPPHRHEHGHGVLHCFTPHGPGRGNSSSCTISKRSGVGFFGAEGQSPSPVPCLWFHRRQQHPCGHGVNYCIAFCGGFPPPHLKNVWLPRLEVEKQKHRSCCQRENKLLGLSAGKMKNKSPV